MSARVQRPHASGGPEPSVPAVGAVPRCGPAVCGQRLPQPQGVLLPDGQRVPGRRKLPRIVPHCRHLQIPGVSAPPARRGGLRHAALCRLAVLAFAAPSLDEPRFLALALERPHSLGHVFRSDAVSSSPWRRCTGVQCNAPCNYPKGECDYATGLCKCSAGVLGANCTGICPTGCSGHGRCVLGADQKGTCVCDVGYRSGDHATSPLTASSC